jgi:hypothetical protein
MYEDLQKCVEIFSPGSSILQYVSAGVMLVTMVVFTFIRKSLPQLIVEIFKAASGSFKKGNK